MLPEELSVAVAGGCLDLEPAIKNPFPTAFPDSKIEDLLPLCIANVAPIAVVDEEDHLLGAVSRLALMSALVTDPDSEV